MPEQKPKKVGRPKMAKGEAKGKSSLFGSTPKTSRELQEQPKPATRHYPIGYGAH